MNPHVKIKNKVHAHLYILLYMQTSLAVNCEQCRRSKIVKSMFFSRFLSVHIAWYL